MKSLPSRGAWIEIQPALTGKSYNIASLPSRGAWIEIVCVKNNYIYNESLPSRGAWIEMQTVDIDKKLRNVAPLAGSVD